MTTLPRMKTSPIVVPSAGLVIVRQGAMPAGPGSQAALTAAVIAAMEAPPAVVRNTGPGLVPTPAQ